MDTINGKQLALVFFIKKICAGDHWTCDVCNASVSQAFSGYTKLCHHINARHKDMIAERLRQSTQRPSNYFQALSYPSKTQSAFAWLECVIMALQVFSFCKQNVVRKHFRHSTISVDSLMRYMSMLTTVVEEKIKSVLPDRFVVIFDGCLGGDTLYVSVFATFPADRPSGFDSVFLAMAPMGDEDSLSAEEHYEFLKFILSVYEKSIENVVALVGDNANTNRAFARRVRPFFVGCHSHRFKLAVNDILANFDTVLEMVHLLMKKMSFEIAAAKLRKLTHLRPKLRNDTRWSSTFNMVDHYSKLRRFLPQIDLPDVQELRLNDEKDEEVDRLFRILDDLDSVTKALQSHDVSLADARVLFNGVMKKTPSTRLRLGKHSHLVENVAFEYAVCKVQNGEEHTLTAAERKSPQHLLKLKRCPDASTTKSEDLSFAARLLKCRRLSAAPTKSRYMDLRFILATSNICERLFLVAVFAVKSRRMSALPTSIESQLFLNVNLALWGISDVHLMLA